MKLSRTIRLLLALGSGAALALAFPRFDLPVFGWIAPGILIVAVVNETPGFALLLGWLQGTAFYALSVPWFFSVLRHYGPLPADQAAGVYMLVVFISASFHGLFAMGVAWLSRVRVGLALMAAPFLLVAMEFAFMHVPAIGFPWNLLGYVAAGNLGLVQVTTFTGIFGLSLVVAIYNTLAAAVILEMLQGKQGGKTPWIVANCVLIVAALVGPRYVPNAPADHVAHLVQTDFPVAMNYPSNWMRAHAGEMDQLEQISIGAAQKDPGIVVWPEVPAPFSLQDPNFLTRAQRIARGAGHGFLVGVVDWKPIGNGQIGAYNSAAMMNSSGALDFVYDKIHLVPFSEYVPWRNRLTMFSGLTGLIGDFQHGSEYKVGELPGGRFSVFICYEAIFPNEVRRFTLAGANLLVNISDDGWFGGSGAPEQHLAMARVRAVENRRWLLRDTNDGITVAVDPYGRIVARLPADTRGELDAPYGFRTDLTTYVRWGDWFAWLCVIVTLVLLLLGAREKFSRQIKQTS